MKISCILCAMAQLIEIHASHPQQRLLQQAVAVLRSSGIIVYPTDSAYALGCMLENKQAKDRICKIRELNKQHHFTLVCRDLSDIAVYAKVDNVAFRLLKANTPGPYTFILPGTRNVPKQFLHAKRKSIGLRIPDNDIVRCLLELLDAPLLSVSLTMPGDALPLSDVYEIGETLDKQVDLIIDGGFCGTELTTVIDMTDDEGLVIVREGKGSLEPFQ